MSNPQLVRPIPTQANAPIDLHSRQQLPTSHSASQHPQLYSQSYNQKIPQQYSQPYSSESFSAQQQQQQQFELSQGQPPSSQTQQQGYMVSSVSQGPSAFYGQLQGQVGQSYGDAMGVHQTMGGPQAVMNKWMNDPTAQLGMQFGSKALQSGTEYVNQNINRYVNITHLKYYFNVSNSYVLDKIKLLLFPFRRKNWHRFPRRTDPSGLVVEYPPPRDDLMAPDLYIPVMAFVTHVLLIGINFGKEQKFHPEILGITASKSLVIVFLEVMIIKLGCYLFSVPAEVPVLDLVGYCGYKFVGIITTAIVQLFLPSWIAWGVLVYTSVATGFFLLRSLKYIVLPENNTSTVFPAARRRRIQFLFIIAALQVFTSWLLKAPGHIGEGI